MTSERVPWGRVHEAFVRGFVAGEAWGCTWALHQFAAAPERAEGDVSPS